MTLPIRYSPSGAIIATLDTGARLRLAEATTPMTGTVDVPFPAGVIGAGGFGANPPLRVALTRPKATLRYRAKLSLDLTNVSTSNQGGVTLYLDTSLDGGGTWTNQAKNFHYVNANQGPDQSSYIEGRYAECLMSMKLGSALGIDDSSPPADVMVRSRAELSLGVVGNVQVSSLATSPGGSPVTGLTGTLHLEIEECL